jgi:hypothetical protein
MVARMNGIHNPIRMYDYRGRLYFSETPVSGTIGVGGLAQPNFGYAPSNQPAPAAGQDNYCYDSSFHTSGAFFTGLSPQTTLQVNVKMLIEVAPGPGSALVTVAKPSPVYDPLALELYSRAINEMPVAVPASMNPAGEWWSGVLSTIGDVAGPALSAIGLAPVGMGVSAAAKMLSGIAKKADGSLEKFRAAKAEKAAQNGLSKAEQKIENVTRQLAASTIRRKSAPKKKKKKNGGGDQIYTV